MSGSLDNVLKDALRMPMADRARLAEQLIRSLDEEVDPDVDAAWQDEVSRRWEDIQAGRTELIPWEVVKERVQRHLRDARRMG